MTRIATPLSFALHSVPTAPRATPPTAARRFQDTLAATTSAVLGRVDSVAALLPGARTVATAIRSTSIGAGAVGGASAFRGASAATSGATSGAVSDAMSGATAGIAGGAGLLDAGEGDAVSLLVLQQRIGLEQQRYQAASNVLKARHDTAKSVISNVR